MAMFVIEDYIPHRGRMKLLDEIVEVDEDTCQARARALRTWPLAAGENIHIIIIIELIAQTVAFSVGWNQKNRVKRAGAGVIVGIKHANFFTESIPVGHTVILKARKLIDRDNYGTFSGSASDQDRVLGDAEIQVYRL